MQANSGKKNLTLCLFGQAGVGKSWLCNRIYHALTQGNYIKDEDDYMELNPTPIFKESSQVEVNEKNEQQFIEKSIVINQSEVMLNYYKDEFDQIRISKAYGYGHVKVKSISDHVKKSLQELLEIVLTTTDNKKTLLIIVLVNFHDKQFQGEIVDQLNNFQMIHDFCYLYLNRSNVLSKKSKEQIYKTYEQDKNFLNKKMSTTVQDFMCIDLKKHIKNILADNDWNQKLYQQLLQYSDQNQNQKQKHQTANRSQQQQQYSIQQKAQNSQESFAESIPQQQSSQNQMCVNQYHPAQGQLIQNYQTDSAYLAIFSKDDKNEWSQALQEYKKLNQNLDLKIFEFDAQDQNIFVHFVIIRVQPNQFEKCLKNIDQLGVYAKHLVIICNEIKDAQDADRLRSKGIIFQYYIDAESIIKRCKTKELAQLSELRGGIAQKLVVKNNKNFVDCLLI